MVCAICGAAIDGEHDLCAGCAALAAREYRKRTLQVFALVGVSLLAGAVALLYFVIGNTSSPIETARAAAPPDSAPPLAGAARPAPSADTLPYLNQVQRALDEALTPIKTGGRAAVRSLHHSPEKAAAIASIEFEDFTYRADQGTSAFTGRGSALMRFENGMWIIKSLLIGHDMRTFEVQIRQ